MSFFTAVSLSFKNLLTKKARTLLTAFAGSIGIIGIALILAFSNGLQTYISSVERDTLSSYPITIEHETMDLTALLSSFGGAGTQDDGVEISENEIRVRSVMTRIMNTMLSQVKSNDLKSFKAYIEEPAIQTELDGYVTAVEYTYDVPLNLYFTGGEAPYQVNPGQIMQSLGMNQPQGPAGMSNPMMGNADMWSPLIPNDEFLADQYDVLAGKMPAGFDEAVLVIGKDNVIPDIMLFALGLSGQAELDEMLAALTAGGELSENTGTYTFDEILSLEYSLLLPTETYEKTPDGGWADKSGDAAFIAGKLAAAPKIKIVGILRPSEDAAAVSENVFIGYTQLLTEYVVNAVNDSEIVKAQLSAPDRDVFTGNPFGAPPVISNMQELSAYINSMPEAERTQAGTAIEQMIAAGMSDEQLLAMMNASIAGSWTQGSYDGNLELLGVTSLDTPSSINIYASSFENKELVAELIDRYNAAQPEGAEITFTDYVGLLMSSVTTVINAISYVLIAFVSISLVVSSIMIGIITYISVLERTREIGVLRSIGASKKDISRVFNAETLIVGLAAGLLGIIVTALLCIPANAIVRGLTGIPNVAILPVSGAVGLVIISMALTLVAGLLPSGIAARKDPVVALRTE
jgi:putative ABC transport system permease protein